MREKKKQTTSEGLSNQLLLDQNIVSLLKSQNTEYIYVKKKTQEALLMFEFKNDEN